MSAGRGAWLVGAYLVGTFPSAYLVARITGAREVIAAASSGASEGDAHVLIDKHVGKGWGAVAAALDVVKGFVYALVANVVAHLASPWLAAVGVLLVVGHCFPPYLRSMAGRGLSAAAGVLLAIAVNARGCAAASYTGSQAGIITDTRHGNAKIIDIRPGRIREALGEGKVVIVAGFQGVSTAYDVTTLGRGGSDTTAVALAAALGAEFCEIYTDVPGVFTADPRIVPGARRLHAVSYEEMLELAASGAKVLQTRSVEYARRYGVKVHVRSSFTDEPGTWVAQEDERMEQAIIS